MRKKNNIPDYLKELLKKYPKVASGRKNHHYHHTRLLKTLELIKKYKKNS